MRLHSMPASPAMMGLDSQSSPPHAVTKASGDLLGSRFTGSRSSSRNGVSRHSQISTSDSHARARFLESVSNEDPGYLYDRR